MNILDINVNFSLDTPFRTKLFWSIIIILTKLCFGYLFYLLLAWLVTITFNLDLTIFLLAGVFLCIDCAINSFVLAGKK